MLTDLQDVRATRRQGPHAALLRFGGTPRWALELGLPLLEHRPGPAVSDASIEAALRQLLREHRPLRFPTSAWLAAMGLARSPPQFGTLVAAHIGRGC